MEPILLVVTATKPVQSTTLNSYGKSEAPTVAPFCDRMVSPTRGSQQKRPISKLTGLTVWSNVVSLEIAAAPKDRIGLAVHQQTAIVSEVDVCRDLIFLCPFGLLQFTNID